MKMDDSFENLINLLSENAVHNVLLIESKQDIINLGFPEIIASYIQNKFGKNATQIAKWFREYHSRDQSTNWWNSSSISPKTRHDLSIQAYVELYNAAKVSEEAYNNAKRKYELHVDEEEGFDQQETLNVWKNEIFERFSEDLFFRSPFIQDIAKGLIKDLKPYKNLSFSEAKDKYDEKRIFADAKPLKVYPNGYKWINVGPRCDLVGKLMKNCGSAGVMSFDPEKTIYTLFDSGNKPHVLVTYSPTEKRVSGAEGSASSEPKDEYHEYILDLAKTLGANFDYDKAKSKALKLRGYFGDNLKSIERLPFKSTYTEYYKITTKDGKTYYSDSYATITPEDLKSIGKKETIDDINDVFSNKRDYPNLDYGWIQ